MIPIDLRCEYAENPLAVDVAAPRLSWRLEARGRARRQSAWQIQAASSLEGLRAGEADLWDTGKVLSGAQLVDYAGRELSAGECCWWRVRVWDESGREGAFSLPARFEMGLSPSDWGATWIGYPGHWPGRSLLIAMAFRIEKEVLKARVHMAGLGWSELWINGQRANDRVLDPPQSDPSKRVFYTTDAVEGFLRSGENVLGVHAGSGWFGAVRVILQMEIDFVDGSRQTYASNPAWSDAWLVRPGPVVQNSVFGGEVYDAQEEVQDWCRPGGPALEKGWTVAMAVDGPGGVLRPAPLEPIRVIETRAPVARAQPRPGVYVMDIGQNLAGWARIRVRGEAGQEVVLRFAESLYEDGTVNQENLRGAKARDVYRCKGDGIEEWEPSFTYHGFRYIQVEGWPGEPQPGEIVARVVHSDVGVRGTFECSNDLLNRIHCMVRWTEKSNLHSIPTDCPQRDERMGWLNDMAARSEELIYNFGAGRLLAKWMGDIEDTQDEAGAISDTAPYRWGRRPADPVSVCYLLVPWLLYTHFGDRRVLAEHYAGMKRWVEFLSGRSHDGILEYSYYGDWSPPVHLGLQGSLGDSAVSRDTPGALVSTACLAYSARLLAQIAQVLDKPRDQARYLRMFEAASLAFNRKFWDEDGGGYGKNNQSANAIALYMGLVPPDRIERCAASLLRAVEKSNSHLSTGNICTKYLLEALAASGRADTALRIALQEDYPSWGFMLANGATTLWERWEKATGAGMNSHNHPMMGSVGSWLYRWLLGIRPHPAQPGFEEFSLRPEILPGLEWARGTLETVRGRVEIDWERKGDDLVLRLVIPPGSTARVGIPAEGWSPLYEGERLIWQDEQPVEFPEGCQGMRREGERVVLILGSGDYRLRAKV